ncbi:MAG: hypothetical protein A2218_10255 [Elusimicrobia bacterium RIFOXYA2_FULL_53_38]|nr:MAG: hypothetical protein A2218_10255 [Elusimicrobia bacterium RIFOXYA2_FULL_53_38]
MTELANKKLEYTGLFTDLEIGVVKNVINEIRRQWPCLEREDFDDLLQACLVKWWTAKPAYDEKRDASLSTFMATVVRNHLLNLKESLLSDKRVIAENTVSLNQPVDDEEGLSELIDLLPAPDPLPAFDLWMTLHSIIPDLSERQQKLCRLLREEGLSVNEASEFMQLSESAIYKEIKRIRTVFEKQGLRDYLP